jgi:hypothetical protein
MQEQYTLKKNEGGESIIYMGMLVTPGMLYGTDNNGDHYISDGVEYSGEITLYGKQKLSTVKTDKIIIS